MTKNCLRSFFVQENLSTLSDSTLMQSALDNAFLEDPTSSSEPMLTAGSRTLSASSLNADIPDIEPDENVGYVIESVDVPNCPFEMKRLAAKYPGRYAVLETSTSTPLSGDDDDATDRGSLQLDDESSRSRSKRDVNPAAAACSRKLPLPVTPCSKLSNCSQPHKTPDQVLLPISNGDHYFEDFYHPRDGKLRMMEHRSYQKANMKMVTTSTPAPHVLRTPIPVALPISPVATIKEEESEGDVSSSILNVTFVDSDSESEDLNQGFMESPESLPDAPDEDNDENLHPTSEVMNQAFCATATEDAPTKVVVPVMLLDDGTFTFSDSDSDDGSAFDPSKPKPAPRRTARKSQKSADGAQAKKIVLRPPSLTAMLDGSSLATDDSEDEDDVDLGQLDLSAISGNSTPCPGTQRSASAEESKRSLSAQLNNPPELTGFRDMYVQGIRKRVDMKVIEHYKRCLSHGGYMDDGSELPIVVFSACYLPDRSRSDYNYTISHRLRKNLQGLYIVHPTVWVKAFFVFSRVFISSKFSRKLRYVETLHDLNRLIPTGNLNIPERVKQ
ncbi:unnamed protein product [Cyprideis torosa]|uniref:CRAL-TRIO domain-containing protein n=1 Tax=Cyprideis torosa TaxID=163714 RepID=A0A7R8WLL1_9CRUS|nr:unnamed protein product [Cyprideis torosa]CAG0901732.1 unnamed protein product [Cyprideis torosa]